LDYQNNCSKVKILTSNLLILKYNFLGTESTNSFVGSPHYIAPEILKSIFFIKKRLKNTTYVFKKNRRKIW